MGAGSLGYFALICAHLFVFVKSHANTAGMLLSEMCGNSLVCFAASLDGFG